MVNWVLRARRRFTHARFAQERKDARMTRLGGGMREDDALRSSHSPLRLFKSLRPCALCVVNWVLRAQRGFPPTCMTLQP